MSGPEMLNRREALARLALVMGGALVGADAFLRGAPLEGKVGGDDFSAADIALLDEIGETIIPSTDTAGAKATGIGAFMTMMVKDCYDDAHHAAFKAGLAEINARAGEKFGHDFMDATPAQRTALLNELDAAQRAHTPPAGAPVHYFRMMKQLTLLGYFTSEIGATKALRFTETPGRYDGNEPYRKGDRGYFNPPSRSL